MLERPARGVLTQAAWPTRTRTWGAVSQAPPDKPSVQLPWPIDIRAVFDLDEVDKLLPENLRFRIVA